MPEKNVANTETGEDGRRKEMLVKRHAQESWIYPIATYFLGLLGSILVFLQFVTIPMGIYCLAKSYINIRNGQGKGIISHVVVGTVLNLAVVLPNVVLIFYALKNR